LSEMPQTQHYCMVHITV